MLDVALEPLTLRKAIARARAYSPEQRERIHTLSRAADERARATRDLTAPAQAPVVAQLLRDALTMRIEAARLPATTLVRSALDEEDMAIVANALDASDPLYFDVMEPDQLAAAVRALTRAERAARNGVEARPLDVLHIIRAARIAAVAIAAAYVLWRVLAILFGPPNVAFHKPIHVTGALANLTPASSLVDGETDVVYAPATVSGPNASFTLDLYGVYAIDRVRIFNRLDGSFDSCLPLDLETSTDGSTWKLQTRKRDHITVWTEPMDGTRARFVRLRTEGSQLGLVEIEVYGRFAPAH